MKDNNLMPREIRPGAFYPFIFILMMCFCFESFGQTLPAGFVRESAATGLSSPTALAVAPDGRIFICQQAGSVRVFKNGSLLSTPFLTKSVNSQGERGLIGIAFDPNFSTNGFVYIYFTLPDATRNRVSRVTASGDVMLAGSEVVILNLDPLSGATNHNGGGLSFGPDGKLYIGVGENAFGQNAQNLDTYLGKLLRINPDGSVPPGNPYTTGSEQRRRVWSYGLRNPYTFDFQPGTGRLFINDVGENTWEEINDATASNRNFGWPHREGYSGDFSSPIYAYSHGGGDDHGCSIGGGAFFNPASTNYPSQYAGKYFYLDYCNSWINYLTINGSTATRSPFGTNLGGSIIGLEVGTDGNLYYLSRSSGALFRIRYTLNNAPVINNHPQSISVAPGQTASFSVTASGTAPFSYQWQKNNVNITGATASTYSITNVNSSHAGQYRAIVSNSAGSATSNAATLTVSNPPVGQILTPAAGTTYRAGVTINYSGDATDAEDGTLPASAFTWWVDFHHDTHTHPHMGETTGSKTGSFSIPTQGETADNVWYRLYLRVRDSNGATQTSFRDILPLKSNITVVTQPAGLQVTIDGQPRNTPFTVASVEGVQRTIGMFTQTSGGVTYEFDSWAHGGAATQTISTPTDDVTYTANYKVGTTPVNLALNKPVVVSSTENAMYTGPNAVDGNAATRWSSIFGDPQWIYVDLGAAYDVNRVKITWEAAYASAYQIQISSNTSTWTNMRSVTGNTTLMNDQTGLAGTGRYVRINGTARGTVYGYSIFELEVYGTACQDTPPAVSITSPANNANFTAPASITISANASTSNGTISKVEFFNGAVKLGEDLTAPYSIVWTNVAAGNYTLTAKATAGTGLTTTSTAVSVTCSNPASKPIPGIIQAESFDAMAGIQTENTTDTGGGQNVGWIDANDWMDYNVNVSTSVNYIVAIRVASLPGGGQLQIRRGTTVLATVNVPSTGGWQNWTTVNTNVNLSAGAQTLRVHAVTGGWNFNWIQFNGPTQSANLALGKPTTTSSIEGVGLEGSKAVDGSGTSRWASQPVEGQWIYVDLGTTVFVNRVKVTWEAAYGRDYQVQISSNASTWTNLRSITGNTSLVNDHTGLSGSGRYIRINGTLRGTQWGYSIYELEVYGALPGTAVNEGDVFLELKNEFNLKLYPNPANHILNIEGLPGNTDQISIYDLTGREQIVVFPASQTNISIDIKKLNSGLHFLRVISQGKVGKARFSKE